MSETSEVISTIPVSNLVKTFLKGKGKLSHLISPEMSKDDLRFGAWDEADSMIMSWLWNSMQPEISGPYMLFTTASEIWEVVQQTYSKKNPTTTVLNGFTLKIRTIPSLQSISPISPNCHPPIISHGAFKSNLFLKVMIFITSLMALILHHHPPLPSLVLHPQIRHTQPENVKIVSSLVLSLVLSPFHYNRLLPAPPLPLMHGNLSQYLCQTISCMLTPTLHLSSPFDKLFESPPNYIKLRVFDCLCYPWFRPYSQHKLDSCSTLCVFLGYSSTQSVYIVYLGRHPISPANQLADALTKPLPRSHFQELQAKIDVSSGAPS
ncbi:Retrovirus-related Pol polyprotein from transposon RE1 [Vitis vinifera]|uniref:Retrovirus-related Pol polyprotein from transposon RE1 n=1 Tax=Vitis vinifera TaxID=29760 RepID=A0A438EA30_VITVI|nr:Retrovirus-related Pol polyprotein from transposon RE1 [Vitis vinifera]